MCPEMCARVSECNPVIYSEDIGVGVSQGPPHTQSHSVRVPAVSHGVPLEDARVAEDSHGTCRPCGCPVCMGVGALADVCPLPLSRKTYSRPLPAAPVTVGCRGVSRQSGGARAHATRSPRHLANTSQLLSGYLEPIILHLDPILVIYPNTNTPTRLYQYPQGGMWACFHFLGTPNPAFHPLLL